jgi:hypothetical protein
MPQPPAPMPHHAPAPQPVAQQAAAPSYAPRGQAGQGNQQAAPQSAPPAAEGGSGLQLAASPRAKSASMSTAPRRKDASRPKPQAQRKKLEQTRFRPRAARSEPRPTPVAKASGGKEYSWAFVGLAVAVGAVLTKVIISFF